MKRRIFISLFACSMAISAFAKQFVVEMTDTEFKPASLQIAQGDTVTWIVKSDMQHTATSGTECKADGKWNSGVLNPGEKFTHVFNSAGNFPYYCIPHCAAGMVGKISVTAGRQTKKSSDESEKSKNADVNKQQNTEKEQGHNHDKNNTTSDPALDPDRPTGEQHQHSQAHKPVFRNTRLVNAHTTEVLKSGFLEFRVVHRWDNITGERGGPHSFFGLDNLRDERLSLEYGITNNLMAGIGRCKGDYTNATAQQVRELYDFFLKYALLKQDNEKNMPVSVSLYANSVISAIRPNHIAGSEADFQSESDRWSFAFQPIVARKFSDKFSLEILPTYVRRNWAVNSSEKDLLSIGAGGSIHFTKRFGIVAEYFYNISEIGNNRQETYYNPLAFGVEFYTGMHIFTINLSNATGILENTFIPYTTSSWLDDGFRMGFSIHRKFNLHRKS